MESARTQTDSLTPSQRHAVAARGNVLVMAGAGTGKTHTLVQRCLDCLCNEGASLDEILVVTFTEAAATEMKQRLRRALEEKQQKSPDDSHCLEQLVLFDTAHIGTLHSFCLKLVREHFYELGLDPQMAVLDEGETRLLADETLDEELQEHYAGQNELAEAVQNLIQAYGGGRDEKIRQMVLRLHHYAQTRPDAEGWLARQIEHFASPAPDEWRIWLLDGIRAWRDEWLPVLENLSAENEKAVELLGIFSRLGSAPASGAVCRAPAPNTKAVEKTNGRQMSSPNANDEGVVGHTRGACAPQFSRETAAEILEQIISADGNWPTKRKTVLREPLKKFFADAAFLHSLAPVTDGSDPLAEDWDWIRDPMDALLRLTQHFAARFAERKRADGVLDFHDLEQFALKLLWDFGTGKPTDAAEHWRKKIRFVFVDEYQDINAAQDKIIQALSREDGWGETPGEPPKMVEQESTDGSRGRSPHQANRFLVGDVKQSIYRFRLADPKIFRDYAKNWRGGNGQVIPLAENFRSRESLLHSVNSFFELLMREEVGGVGYDAEARLQFGAPEHRTELGLAKNPSPRAELLLRLKSSSKNSVESDDESGGDDLADLEEAAKEARLLALRLKELKESHHKIWDGEKGVRAVEWRDMAVLLRAPSNKAEAYAKEFERADVPLVVERGGFYESTEIADLLSLLKLLDNPLQDVPVMAVLRSLLVGCSLDELAQIRLAAPHVHFWTALNRIQNSEFRIQKELLKKVGGFLDRYRRWRQLARQASLSRCLEDVLAETHYAEWLLARPRGAQRRANVERFLGLVQKFDQFQRQGLFRFLKFIEAQREAGAEPDVAAIAEENAVRLMSIHQSKGLEFPVVAVANLAKPFNEQDLREEIIFDEQFGLCPCVKPPHTGRRYPSLPHWLAQQHQRREQWGEELRLLYVAMTRARDTLILTATVTEKKWEALRTQPAAITTQAIISAKSYADWLALWFRVHSPKSTVQGLKEGELPHLRWRIADDAELRDDSICRSRGDEAQTKDQSETPHVVSYKNTNELDATTVERLRAILSWEYEFSAATERPAKSSVTALRRQAEELDDEAEQKFQVSSFKFSEKRPVKASTLPAQSRKSEIPAAPEHGGGWRNPQLNAVDAGTAHHKFLQHVSIEKAGDVAALEAEAKRLEREKVLSVDDVAALDFKAVAAFWNSEPGKKILKQAANVKRELAFTAKFSPKELDEILGKKSALKLDGEFVVVQGVADLVVLLPKEIWIIDFKTDEVRADELQEKIKIYEPQLKLYARALAKIYARPVMHCWLHFLKARKTEEVKV
jgi:ATP-dependent helicase/nuclease subunit A